MASPIRVGIDVGGTFTDAVAVDADTSELIGQAKVLTTHHHADGVARGIVEALEALLVQCSRTSQDVVFLAHGTTQATNAMLEGDVATVGAVSVGRGIEGWRTRRLTRTATIEFAPGRPLPVRYTHARGPADADAAVAAAIDAGADVVAAIQAFSVDDAEGEQALLQSAARRGVPATASSDISGLYGLKKRARTAVLNAGILPRMLATAELVQSSIDAAGIGAPLMVMRCDGGVMSLDEMRRRPLLTILSGPAAGTAGALLSERVSDGIFCETGGTSTDISVIQNGRVAVDYINVAGHSTYLKGLDVRTVGVGGGSLARISGHQVVAVGPRSAHIAGLPYACFADPADLEGGELELHSPMAGDPGDYATVVAGGRRFAITVTCAANALGLVPDGDHAAADPAAAQAALRPLAAYFATDVEAAAERILAQAAKEVGEVVDKLIKEYRLDRDAVRLVGGGGGAATVTPYLGRSLSLPAVIADNNEVISPIGVALALVRDSVERLAPNPSPQDLLEVRAEAEAAVLAQGAAAGTIEIEVSVDPRRNIITAVATGATELRTRDGAGAGPVAYSDLQQTAAESLRVAPHAVDELAANDHLVVFGARKRRGGPLGRLTRERTALRVVARDNVVRLARADGLCRSCTVASSRSELAAVLDEHTTYGDSGARIPALQMVVGARIVNLGGVAKTEDVLTLADTELAGRLQDEQVILLVEVRR